MLKSHRQTVFQTLARHPIHPFPARMAPGIAFDALGESNPPLRVLDPMTGSGTVLAVARSRGHKAIGIDLDPLAVLMATVWTRTVNAEKVHHKAEQVLKRARTAFLALATGNAYPIGSDEETRKFIRFWFDGYARRQLAALSTAISRVHDEATRDVIWCAFSRLIITKKSGASLAMDLSHSRPHKVFERSPIKPFNQFMRAVETVISNCPQKQTGPVGPVTTVKRGDARKLVIPDDSIDLVLTSPPYLNAIDYMRCSKFSLVWMGYTIKSLRAVRSQSVGHEAASRVASEDNEVRSLVKNLNLTPKLGARDDALLCRYVYDMRMAVKEAARVLTPGGRAVYVVGDSTIRGTFVRNSAVVEAVAKIAGLRLQARRARTLPPNRRYLPPPSKKGSGEGLDARMRREIVLAFRKPAA